MEEEQKDAVVESSTTEQQDANPDSSQEAPVEATTNEAVQGEQEVPFNQHPRFQELIEERNYYKDLAKKAVERPIMAQPQQAQQEDEYAGMSQEEKQFFQKIEKIAERKAHKIVEEKEEGVRRELNETRQILATVAYERFQAKHPDVPPNSPEEAQIAQLYQRGYSLDDAYKVAMFDKVKNQKVQAAQVKSNQTVQKKIAANMETSSIPASSGLPQVSTKKGRERIAELVDNFLKQ